MTKTKTEMYSSRYEHSRRLGRETNTVFKLEKVGNVHPLEFRDVVILDEDICKRHMIDGDTKYVYCILPLGSD